VNVDSAKWGTHLGTVLGLDHLAIINRMTVMATIPHLAAAEKGWTAPVQPVDNNLVQVIANRVEGTVNALLGPKRAMLGLLGIRF